ncbi:MAG: hypothetical protein JNL74_10860, partial [Fibrobacteres bacterium]|nr:hypothetical protein [Fibrobacterota bacterium]
RSEIALKKTDAKLHPIGAGEQLVQEVLAKAKSGKVSITSLEAGAVIKGAAFDELSLKIKAEGSFKELLTFFRALETATPSFNLSSLSMTADDKGILRSDFIVKAMVRHEETK